jgi:hypothetical protein
MGVGPCEENEFTEKHMKDEGEKALNLPFRPPKGALNWQEKLKTWLTFRK